MKVRYEGASDFEQRILQGSRSLTVGDEYTVLEVYAQSDGANFFRIEYSEKENPSLLDSRLFQIVSSRIPEFWCITSVADGSLTMGPSEWNVPGFWEAFMEHEEWAIDVYRSIRSKVVES
jgi:hypothetical protein